LPGGMENNYENVNKVLIWLEKYPLRGLILNASLKCQYMV